MAEDAHRGTITNGYDVVAVPLYSGGSGGVFTQIVFARRSNAPLSYVGLLVPPVICAWGSQKARLSRRCPTTAPKTPTVPFETHDSDLHHSRR